MPRAIDACLGVVLVAALAAPARAGGEEWSVAFERGLADMLAGRYETGCPALAESYRLAAKPGTLFTLAECEAKWGKSASALTHYEEYQTLFAGMTPEQRAQQKGRDKVAIEARAKLEREVPHLTLALPPGAPPSTVVRRDGVILGPDAVAADARVDPGEHLITTEVPGGGPAHEQRVTLAPKDHKRLELEISAPPPAAAGPPPEQADAPPASRRTWVYVAAGVGVAGLAVGGVTGALALGKKGTVSDHCDVDAHRCDSEGKDAVDAGQTLGAISTVGFVVGAAGAAAAVVLFLTEPKAAGNHGGTEGARRSHEGQRIISSLRAVSVPSVSPLFPALGVEGSW